VQVVLN